MANEAAAAAAALAGEVGQRAWVLVVIYKLQTCLIQKYKQPQPSWQYKPVVLASELVDGNLQAKGHKTHNGDSITAPRYMLGEHLIKEWLKVETHGRLFLVIHATPRPCWLLGDCASNRMRIGQPPPRGPTRQQTPYGRLSQAGSVRIRPVEHPSVRSNGGCLPKLEPRSQSFLYIQPESL